MTLIESSVNIEVTFNDSYMIDYELELDVYTSDVAWEPRLRRLP